MIHVLFGFLLFLMLLPAALAVLFASRSPLVIIWNLSWFYLMGLAGEHVFSSPSGQWIGAFFAAIYIFRVISKPALSQKFVFQSRDFRFTPQPGSRYTHRSRLRDVREAESDVSETQSAAVPDSTVIDVEYTKQT